MPRASAIIDDPDAGWNQGANHRPTPWISEDGDTFYGDPYELEDRVSELERLLQEGSLNKIGQDIWHTAQEKGFHEPLPEGVGEKAVKMLLMITEICEAFEAIRKDLGQQAHDEEVADTLIRLLHYTAHEGIDVDAEVKRKMEINRGRPHKHGKKF